MKSMNFLDNLKAVKSCSDYEEINKDDYILAHGYLENVGESEWEIGFYNERDDKMLVFNTKPPKIKAKDDVMKSGKTIAKLDTSKINVEFKEAMNIANKFLQDQKIKGDLKKTMAILQNLSEQVWNITFITKQLEVVNIKIKTDDGTIHDTTVDNLLNWGRAV